MDLVVTIVRKREITLRPGNHRNLSKGNGSRRYFFFFYSTRTSVHPHGNICTSVHQRIITKYNKCMNQSWCVRLTPFIRHKRSDQLIRVFVVCSVLLVGFVASTNNTLEKAAYAAPL